MDTVQQHFSAIASRFLEFRRSSFMCDTILYVGEKEFRVHGMLLASASQFFDSLLKGYDKPELRHIRLPHLNPEVLAVMLDYIYTGKLILPYDEEKQEFNMPPKLMESFMDFGINLIDVNGELITYKREEDFSYPATNVKEDPESSQMQLKTESSENQFKTEVPSDQAVNNTFSSKPYFNFSTKNEQSHDFKSYACIDCGLTFEEKAELREHRRMHVTAQPYLCTDCGDQFPTEYDLVCHIREEHKEHLDSDASLTCTTCEERFHNSLALSQHECAKFKKNYICRECNKNFPFPSQLTTHMKIHTGERPFACDFCKKSFSAMLNLTQHLRTHTGDRPYSCNSCPKKFTQRSHLLTHLRTHTGEKPFVCQLCPKAYKNRLDLRLHCQKKHRIDIRLREANHPNSSRLF